MTDTPTSLHPAHAELARRSLETFAAAARSRGFDNPEHLASLVLDAAAAHLRAQPTRSSGLTEDQARYFVESGSLTEDELAYAEKRISDGALEEYAAEANVELLTTSITAADAAEFLGIDESSVRHRQAKNSLYGFLYAGRRRYPTWQFVGTRHGTVPPSTLPHLRPVLNAFDADEHPSSVNGFMTAPQSDLLIGPTPVPPVEWLRAGHDPETIVGLIEGMNQW